MNIAMRITAITPEQEARFAEWREKWIRIGLSTEPADFDRAEKAVLKTYVLAGLEPPKVILRMSSPFGAIIGGTLAWLTLRKVSLGTDQKIGQNALIPRSMPFWFKVARQIRDKVRQHVGRQVSWQVGSQILTEVEHQITRRVWERIRAQVRLRIWNQVDQQALEQVLKQVWEQIGRQARQIGLEVELENRQQRDVFVTAKDGFRNSYDIGYQIGWCAYITFLRDVLGWQDPVLENFSIDEDLTTSCGWVWLNKYVLAISDRPSEIHLDAEGRLHNESGPSIAYRDGWKLYHIHGVAVPDFVVERPEAITVKHITEEANAEVRRVMVERMGLERFVRESGLQPVHSDDFGTLYRAWMPGDEPLVVVKVVNSTPESDGSRKEYFLRVPPHVTRAREAVAWTFGMKEEDYLPNVET